MNILKRNRWIIVAFTHYVCLFTIEQINYYLAPYGISILVTGMLITFSSLVLTVGQGALSLFPIALYIDCDSPLPFGISLFILIGVQCLLVGLKYQFRRESEAVSLASSLLANFTVYLLYSLSAIVFLGSSGLNSVHIGLNLLVSGAVIALINAYYFKVQIDILELFGIRIAQEQRTSR